MTPAQFAFMLKVITIENAAVNDHWGVYWSPCACGHGNTWRACARRGWIKPASASAQWLYQTTPEGRQAFYEHGVSP